MDSKWLPWVLVGAIVLFFIWRREQGTGGGGIMNFFGTPSNPVNAPTSGDSFCGVGTIAAGVPAAPSPTGGCVATPKSAPPAHFVFPVCHGGSLPIRRITPPIRIVGPIVAPRNTNPVPIPVVGGL